MIVKYRFSADGPWQMREGKKITKDTLYLEPDQRNESYVIDYVKKYFNGSNLWEGPNVMDYQANPWVHIAQLFNEESKILVVTGCAGFIMNEHGNTIDTF